MVAANVVVVAFAVTAANGFVLAAAHAAVTVVVRVVVAVAAVLADPVMIVVGVDGSDVVAGAVTVFTPALAVVAL